jgi:ribonuclease P protein component
LTALSGGGSNRSFFKRGHVDETHVSALRSPAEANPRVPCADAYARRAGRDQGPSRQGPLPSRRLTAKGKRLTRGQRLGNADVAAALKNGVLTRATRLYLYRSRNSLGYPRLALIVPKRLAPRSVTRNRIRRLMREAFRIRQDRLGGWDYVLRLVKTDASAISRAEIETLLLRCDA